LLISIFYCTIRTAINIESKSIPALKQTALQNLMQNRAETGCDSKVSLLLREALKKHGNQL